MKRPSFQFYPDDWAGNSNLRRCSHEEKGIWIDVLCVLHDQDEYGIARWPLAELAQAAGTTKAKLKRLVEKGVLKGVDQGGQCQPMVFVPRSGRRDGEPVTLIDQQAGPIWYSSRMVLDEYKRKVRGGTEVAPKDTPDLSPKGGIGEDIDDAPKSAPKDTPDLSPSRAGASSPSPSPLKTNTSSARADFAGTRFQEFWETWPRTDRRTAKAECLKRWRLRGLDAHADEIMLHLTAMKTTKKWLDGFEPAPLTYLNQRHWEDGIPLPAVPHGNGFSDLLVGAL